MKTSEQLFNKLHILPEYLQLQALDYIDFLLERHCIDANSGDEPELTSGQKRLLTKRYKMLKSDPGRGIKWSDAQKALIKKYDF